MVGSLRSVSELSRLSNMQWLEKAACRTANDPVADWYADKGTVPFHRAVAICRECPVQPECLHHAHQSDERYGVWGGLSPIERDRQRRLRQHLDRTG